MDHYLTEIENRLDSLLGILKGKNARFPEDYSSMTWESNSFAGCHFSVIIDGEIWKGYVRFDYCPFYEVHSELLNFVRPDIDFVEEQGSSVVYGFTQEGIVDNKEMFNLTEQVARQVQDLAAIEERYFELDDIDERLELIDKTLGVNHA